MKTKQRLIIPFFVFLLALNFHSIALLSQSVAINTDGSTADASAMLEVKSTTKGMLVPRVTMAQRLAIAAPATGLLVYDTDTNTFWFYNGNIWMQMLVPATKTKTLSVSAVAFATEGAYNRSTLAGGIYITDGTAGTQGNLDAGVNLPDGAVVIGIDAYVLDNDGTAGRDISYAQLWRQDGAVGTSYGNAVMMAQTTGTSGASTVIQKISTTSISSPTIDNSNYCYYLRVGSFQNDVNLMLFKVVIKYAIAALE
jgi:hypothetical protein